MPTDASTSNFYTRREALKLTAAGVAGLASAAAWPSLVQAAPQRKRLARVAHLTDVHVQPERAADQGMIACLHHVQELKDKPDLILTGGDSIMDSFAQDVSRSKMLWSMWRDVLKKENSLRVEACIGNHDVWGWNKKKSGASGNEPLYGKQWAVEALNIGRRYRSFDFQGWHFIVLDSTHPAKEPGNYIARLDEEQFGWLASDLQSVSPKTPVLVLSHIPILSAAAFFDGENEKDDEDWKVPGAWMHIDSRRIKDLFLKHPNVKVCLSGHLHLLDRVDYNGVAYLCNGAVCGGWWKGNNQECEAGYGLVDLYDDGSFESKYVPYGWQPRE